MPSEQLETIFRRDLDRLPGLAEDQLVPRSRSRPRSRFGAGHVFAVLGMTVLALGIGLSLQAIRNAQPADDSGAATSAEPFFIVTEESAASPSVSPEVALTWPPMCPRGQAPLLDVAHPPPPGTIPGTGVSGPDAAFRRARPNASEYTMFVWGDAQPLRGPGDPRITGAPIWIVAGSETFVAIVLGGAPRENSWFAYPAKFIRCMTPPNQVPRPSPTRGPVG